MQNYKVGPYGRVASLKGGIISCSKEISSATVCIACQHDTK